MFQGASAINLDAKGRMSIPAKHRDALTVNKSPHGRCQPVHGNEFFWEMHQMSMSIVRAGS
ncbi:MAG: hypothetical protein HYZ45_12200 [Burkholderiales bacterium]|nr:hypothetical protein [Burkholderiales bacterium]